MTQSRSRGFILFVVLAMAISPAVFAAKPVVDTAPASVSDATVSSSAVQWQTMGSFDRAILSVSGPEGFSFSKEFAPGVAPMFQINDLGKGAVDGAYSWELRVVPRVSLDVKRKLAQARQAGADELAAQIQAQAGLNRIVSASGGFSVSNGAFVPGSGGESRAGKVAAAGLNLQPKPLDQVIPDDLIVQGSTCTGLDCVNNESFGFDTIRLKENNTRIKFDDTSTGTCPANDWQLTANDACPGGNNFKIEDITGAKVPFTITAGAATNSIFVDSTGRVGLRTSTPVLDLHIATSNTPAVRLEQNNSGGFTAQTWDVAGNEANFFVRDVTGGSRLPFRIRPGAPTSSIDIAASGFVGVGTASPVANVDVFATANPIVTIRDNNSGLRLVPATGINFIQSGTSVTTSDSKADLQFTSINGVTAWMTIKGATGNVGIGTTSPGSQLVIANGGTTSSVNAGATQFTVASSRTFKENIEPVSSPDILTKIEAVPVVTYDFKDNGPKNRLGLIAEDFYKVLGRGDEKHIDGQDVQMALWLAVQQLTAENKDLKDRLAKIEQKQ